MSPTERRQELLDTLNLRREDTYDNLAREFKVSKRTIRYDIEVLICSYPIETVRGRHGCVRLADWFHLDRKKLTHKEANLLRRISCKLNGDDLDTLNGILLQFAPYTHEQ